MERTGGVTSYSLNSGTLSADDLSSMTIAQIKELAAERGYSITATLKAEIINQFLEAQNNV